MIPILFFSEHVVNPIPDSSVYQEILSKIITFENRSLISLTYIFCSDDFLLDINSRYLGHQYLTDVITFDHSEKALAVEGDIYISLHRVNDNSLLYSVSFLHELHRVMIHGLLHLIGYFDCSSSQKKLMRFKENLYLSYFVS